MAVSPSHLKIVDAASILRVGRTALNRTTVAGGKAAGVVRGRQENASKEAQAARSRFLASCWRIHQFGRIEHRLGRSARVFAMAIVGRTVVDPLQCFVVVISQISPTNLRIRGDLQAPPESSE